MSRQKRFKLWIPELKESLNKLEIGLGLDIKSVLYLLLSDLKIVTPTNRCVAVINLISCIGIFKLKLPDLILPSRPR